MKTITIKLTYVKETKGTHVYGTDEEGAAITTLYIRKSSLPKDAPQEISVTVAAIK